MPSLQSYVFRAITQALSIQMNRRAVSIPQLRALMGMGGNTPRLPRGTTSHTTQADGVPVEWLEPPVTTSPAVMLYLHGGAWTLGWYNSHRWLVAHLGQAAQCRALAVDYRLAPEHPFPAALEDGLTAYRWLLKHGTSPNHLILAGDSAGGNLALAMMLALREAGEPLPAAAVCLSPVTDLAATGESFHTRRDPLLTPGFLLAMIRHYVGQHDVRHPLISPHYGNLAGLPPVLIQVGQDELLLSDATRLADQARAAGVSAHLAVWPHMWHGWHVFVPYLPEAQNAVQAVGQFVRGHVA